MSFSTPAAWHYYLPAYLIQSIESGQFSSAYLRPTTTNVRFTRQLAEHRRQRIERLTSKQRRIVVAFLLAVSKENGKEFYDENKKAVRYWKELYAVRVKAESDTSSPESIGL